MIFKDLRVNTIDAIESSYLALMEILYLDSALFREISSFLADTQKRYIEQHYSNLIFEIEMLLNNLRCIFDDIKRGFAKVLKVIEQAHGVSVELSYRLKTPYSLFIKLRGNNMRIGDVTDIIGFRCIVPTDKDCYLLLRHLTYYLQQSFLLIGVRDYISLPKENGYRSIHMLCMHHDRTKFEVQIRTCAMNDIAEFGGAAHIEYKYLQFKNFLKLQTKK